MPVHFYAVCDLAQLTGYFQGKTTVFHVAALVGPYFPHDMYDKVNHQGTRNVVAACKAAKVKSRFF